MGQVMAELFPRCLKQFLERQVSLEEELHHKQSQQQKHCLFPCYLHLCPQTLLLLGSPPHCDEGVLKAVHLLHRFLLASLVEALVGTFEPTPKSFTVLFWSFSDVVKKGSYVFVVLKDQRSYDFAHGRKLSYFLDHSLKLLGEVAPHCASLLEQI